jgi:hypothetical protein
MLQSRLFQLFGLLTSRAFRPNSKSLLNVLIWAGITVLTMGTSLAWATTMSIDSYPNPAVAGKNMTYHVIATGIAMK